MQQLRPILPSYTAINQDARNDPFLGFVEVPDPFLGLVEDP